MTLSPFQVGWFVFLAVAWAALLFGSYLLPRAGSSQHRGRTLLLSSSAVLAIAGWSWFLAARNSPVAAYALLIAIGMTCGLLGDLFMAQVLRLGSRMIAGMGSFGIGHIFYIAAGLALGDALGGALDAPAGGLLAPWLAWLLLGAAAWYVFICRGQRRSILHWIALPYGLLLASTAGVATGRAIQFPQMLPFAIGAALFLISDFMIAIREFTGRRSRLIADGIWLTYGPGQALIVFSVWFAGLAAALR